MVVDIITITDSRIMNLEVNFINWLNFIINIIMKNMEKVKSILCSVSVNTIDLGDWLWEI